MDSRLRGNDRKILSFARGFFYRDIAKAIGLIDVNVLVAQEV